MHVSDRGGCDWDGRDTNSWAADAPSNTSQRIEKLQTEKLKVRKKHKKQKKVLQRRQAVREDCEAMTRFTK